MISCFSDNNDKKPRFAYCKQLLVFMLTVYTIASCIVTLTGADMLVAPLRRAERFADLNAAEVADMFLCAQKVAKVVEKHFSASATTIAIQDGADAGQTIKVLLLPVP